MKSHRSIGKVFRYIALLYFFVSVSPVAAYYTNMPASVVIGQPDFNSGSANQGGSVNGRILSAPQGVYNVRKK